jgi:hypothetical protein
MCITSHKAELKSTKIISFRKEDGNVYLAYSNTVRNLSDKRNVMLLPIPGEVRGEWFYDTTNYSNYLNEISRQTTVSEAYAYGVHSRGSQVKSKSLSMSRVDVGQYEILFSKDFDELHRELTQAGVEVSAELIEFFVEHYPGFTLVACLFDSNKTIDAQPIALEYKPISNDILFFPTMDSHDGSIPRISDERVALDHHIISELEYGDPEKGLVSFTQEVPEFLKDVRYGTYKLRFFDSNGDIYVRGKYQPTLNRSFHNLVRQQQVAIDE